MEKVIKLTFDDWQNRRLPPSIKYINGALEGSLLRDNNGEWQLYSLSEKEFEKIAETQNDIFSEQVDLFLKGKIDDFEQRFSNSLDKASLVESELQNVCQWLTDKDLSGPYSFPNPNGGTVVFTDLKRLFRTHGEDTNLFPYWYNELIIQGRNACAYMEPQTKNEHGQNKTINLNYQSAVYVLFKYKKYLENRQRNGDDLISTQETLFKDNPASMALARQMGLINEAGKWVYKPIEKPLAAFVWLARERDLFHDGVSPNQALRTLAKDFGLRGKHKNTWNKFQPAELRQESKRLLGEMGE